MNTAFRFLDLLQSHDPSIKMQGIQARIVDWSMAWKEKGVGRKAMERHKLSRVLSQKDSSISFAMLDCLCDFLIQEIGVPAHRLPHELFGARKEDLLELICSNSNATFFVGTRQSEEWGRNPYVVATDASLRIELTRLALRHASFSPAKSSGMLAPNEVLIPAPMRHVRPTAKSAEWKVIATRGSDEYQRFLEHKNRTLIATGSTKANVLVEQILAWTFGDQPHKNSRTANRNVPIFFRYREAVPLHSGKFTDPQPPSCCGGLSIASQIESREPGIYFVRDGLGEQTRWECIPCDDDTKDVAFVVYTQDENNRVSLACGGFSSRATHFLSQCFEKLLGKFWPPQLNLDTQKVGVFLVRFRHQPDAESGEFAFPEVTETEVVRLDDNVVQERIQAATTARM